MTSGFINYRDVGPLHNDQVVVLPCGILYRAGVSPSIVTAKTLDRTEATLAAIHFDLRTEAEIERAPISAVADRSLRRSIDSWAAVRGATRPNVAHYTAAYEAMLPMGVSIAAEILSHLSRSTWPVLVTCSAGKDRTGLVVAAVLMALGVSPKCIVEEHMRSRQALGTVRIDGKPYHHYVTPLIQIIRHPLAMSLRTSEVAERARRVISSLTNPAPLKDP